MSHIEMLSPDGSVSELRAEASDQHPWWIVCDDIDGGRRKFEAPDLFDALIAIRRSFEAHGCRLLCAGARRDVWPSRMTRDMAGGRKAYILRLGSPAEMEDLVDIFDYAAPNLVGTIEEQRVYYNKWIDFFRGQQ